MKFFKLVFSNSEAFIASQHENYDDGDEEEEEDKEGNNDEDSDVEIWINDGGEDDNSSGDGNSVMSEIY